MKKLLLLVCTILTSVFVNAQEVLVVDNNFNAPTGANVFTTLQEAADAAEASPGIDIIQVKPSASNYGNITINSQVILEGIGFNLTKDFPLQSVVADIRLTDNGDGSQNASGTIIRGLIIDEIFLGILTSGSPYTLNDVVIDNCQINNRFGNYTGSYTNINNLEVKFSWLRNGGNQYDIDFYNIDNSTIRNNIIDGRMRFDDTGVSVNTVTNNFIFGEIYVESFVNSVFILNNVFVGATGSNAFYYRFRNGTVSDNVFIGRAPQCTSENDFTGNNFSNNLTFNTSDDTMPPNSPANVGIDNIEGQSPLFASVPLGNSWNSSLDFTPDPSSPLYLVNNGIKDIGIEFGAHPFTQSNITLRTTSAPTIEILNSTAVVNPGDNLNIRVKVKGN